MKYCANCGAELDDTARFCGKCGVRVSDTEFRQKKTQAHRHGLRVIVIIAVILIFVIGAYTLFFTPARRLLFAINSGDFSTAQSILGKNRDLTNSSFVVDGVNRKIIELQGEYEKESQEYAFVKEQLDGISQLNITGISAQLANSQEAVSSLYRSRNFKTVYLLTSKKISSRIFVNDQRFYGENFAWKYGYDEQGRLTGYSYNGTDLKYSYDKNGYLVSISAENAKGKYIDIIVNHWNDTLEEYTGMVGENNVSIEISLDKNGNPVSEEIIDQDGTKRLSFVYDENNNLCEKKTYPPNSEDYRTTKYDACGRVVESITKNIETEEILSKQILNYDEKGHLTYSELVDDIWDSCFSVKYTYNDAGQIATILIESDGEYAKGEFTGSKTYRTITFDGNITEFCGKTYIVEFDNNGNLLKQTEYDKDGLYQETEYTYIAMELPIEHKMPNTNDPRYLCDYLT